MGRAQITLCIVHAATKKSDPPVLDKSDSRFEPVGASFAVERGFNLMESKSVAMRELMLNDKTFGRSPGRFILKLVDVRTAALVDADAGDPFGPGAGRRMKDRIEITNADAAAADRVALAHEAFQLTSDGA